MVPVVFPHFMTSKEKALQKQEQQLKSNLGSDNDGNSSHASDNLMKFCYFGDKMLETDISCAVLQTPAVGENLSGDFAALVGDMQNRCGVDPTVIGSEESDINSSRDGTASLDGLDSDSRCSMEDLEELDRKFRQCSYSNRNPISQSRLASQMGDFQVPEIGDLKSEAADELMEVRNQRLAMKTISKKLVIPALESDECCWPGTTSSCGAGARCVPMADSGREVELKSEVAIQVERVNMGGVGNQISPSDEAEGDSVPITIAPSIKHKKTIPVSFRSRRIIYIRDYEFDVKNIAIFVDAPLEFRLSRDVPLHAEHILVGHSGSGVGGEQCFESPLLQVSLLKCFDELFLCFCIFRYYTLVHTNICHCFDNCSKIM